MPNEQAVAERPGLRHAPRSPFKVVPPNWRGTAARGNPLRVAPGACWQKAVTGAIAFLKGCSGSDASLATSSPPKTRPATAAKRCFGLVAWVGGGPSS